MGFFFISCLLGLGFRFFFVKCKNSDVENRVIVEFFRWKGLGRFLEKGE